MINTDKRSVIEIKAELLVFCEVPAGSSFPDFADLRRFQRISVFRKLFRMIVRCRKAAQRGKHFIDRHEDLRKAALTDNRCDLVKRVRSVSVKLADSRADQLLHTSVAAQFFADIVAQGADVGALGAQDAQQPVAALVLPQHLQLMDELCGFRRGLGQDVLAKLAEVLNKQSDIDVYIEGHTDSKPINTAQFKDNWDLSVIRATSVVRILTKDYGVKPLQIQPCGRGEFMPVADNETADGRAKNRRTEIIMAPKLDKLYQMLNQ